MKNLRQLHLYLGCIFAPLIIYFSLSGAWQTFRFNDVPKDEPPTVLHSVLHELSKPHTSSTLPGANPKTDQSLAFSWVALFMGLGMITTAVLGIVIALRGRAPKVALLCLGAGTAIPILLLLLKS
jgi:hypothetical protein